MEYRRIMKVREWTVVIAAVFTFTFLIETGRVTT